MKNVLSRAASTSLAPSGFSVACLCVLAVAAVVATPRPAEAVKVNVRRLARALQGGSATQPAAPAETCRATDLPLKKAGADGELAARLKPFDRPPETFSYVLQLVSEDDAFRLYRLEYPSPWQSPWPENNVVPCELYLPRRAGDEGAKGGGEGKLSGLPAAIVLDIMDGSAVIPRGLAQGLAGQGVAALYVPMSCYGPRRPRGDDVVQRLLHDPNLAIDNIRQTVMDIRRAKAILAGRPEVDRHRLAITGVSLGGIMTALAAGVDGEFDRVVPVLAGGDLPDIIFHARETRKIREAIEAGGMSREDAARFLAPIEPLNFASRVAPGSCLMINAARDEVIPKETTEALNKALGSPQILWTPAGHYSSVWFLPDVRRCVIDFILGRKVRGLGIDGEDGPH